MRIAVSRALLGSFLVVSGCLTLTGQPLPAPTVEFVVELYGQQEAYAPGSILDIFGTLFGFGFGVRVSLGSVQLPVLSIASPYEIRAQIPYTFAPGTYPLVVSNLPNGRLSTPISLVVSPLAPALVTRSDGRALVVNTNGKDNEDNQPAIGGTVVSVRLASLGAVTNPPAPGALTPGLPVASATEAVVIRFGSITVPAQNITLVASTVGVYRARFKVPNLGCRKHELTVGGGGQISNAGYFTLMPNRRLPISTTGPCALAPATPAGGVPEGFTDLSRENEPETPVQVTPALYPGFDVSLDNWYGQYDEQNDNQNRCGLNMGGWAPRADPPPSQTFPILRA